MIHRRGARLLSGEAAAEGGVLLLALDGRVRCAPAGWGRHRKSTEGTALGRKVVRESSRLSVGTGGGRAATCTASTRPELVFNAKATWALLAAPT